MSLIGPIPALITLVCSGLFFKAVLERRNQGDFLVVYALGIAPIVAYASSFLIFNPDSAYLDDWGIILITALTVIVTFFLLWLAHVATGYVPPAFGNRLIEVRAKNMFFVSIFCLGIVTVIVYLFSRYPVLTPCTTARCSALEFAFGDKTQAQNIIVWISYLINFLMYLFLTGVRAVFMKVLTRS